MANKKTVKSISFALCITLIFMMFSASVCAEGAVWEETYYGTPTSYYTGAASAKNLSDSSFDDWAGANLVSVDAKVHPENFFKQPANDLSYRYAFAWDNTNLYIYLQVDEDITSLTELAPCLYFDLAPATNAKTGVIYLKYEAGNMIVSRAECKVSSSNSAFLSSIKVFGKQIGTVTHIEASIPWAATMETAFTAADGASMSFCLGVNSQESTSILYANETTAWGSTQPTSSSKNYIPLYLTSGTPAYNIKTPMPLSESALLTVPYIDINASLGKPYSGTSTTLLDWTQSTGKGYLTEGSFGAPSEISGDYSEAFGATDRESDGSIVKTVDLGEVKTGLYKFSIGAAQITQKDIVFPDSIKVYASENGYHYQYLGTASALDTSNYQSETKDGTLKETKKYNLLLSQGFSARYIKYKIAPSNTSNAITCLTELASYYQTESASIPKKDSIVSLGAKINVSLKGIRFGAQYNKDPDKTVKQIGVLIYPSDKLGSQTLDLPYYNSNPYNESNQSGVLLVNAVMISASDFVAGKSFEEYDSFVFFATLTSIPEVALSENITAVPFVEYTDGVVFYGAALVRSYNGVLAASEAIDE